MIRASIDIGSNSCLLLVLNIEENQFNILEEHSEITSLGKDLDVNKAFLDKSIADTLKALGLYYEILKKYNISSESIIVTATEASRVAGNFDSLAVPALEKYGFNIQRISGEGEAYYTALGVAKGASNPKSDITIMDIGGASTEFIKVNVENFKINSSISLPVGSVRATDWLSENEFENEMSKLLKNFDISEYKTDRLICVAGTMTTVATMLQGLQSFDREMLHGYLSNRNELNDFVDRISHLTPSDILKEYPVCGKRAFSIYGGSLVARKLMDKLGVEEFEVSTYGLRYGVTLEGKIDEQYLSE